MPHPLGDPRYVRFTTFRRSGEPVHTPVWFAEGTTGFVFSTGPDSGKVKRLRRTPRVEVAASDVRGRVAPGTPVFTGTASATTDPEITGPAAVTLAAKYRVQWHLVGLGDRFRRLIGRPAPLTIVTTVLDPSPVRTED